MSVSSGANAIPESQAVNTDLGLQGNFGFTLAKLPEVGILSKSAVPRIRPYPPSSI